MDERKPAPPGDAAAEHTPRPAAGPDGDFELARPTAGTGPGTVGAPSVGAESMGAERVGADPARAVEAEAPVGRDKPLHDPDPYSTPPYGEPGPWAPAPPVPHPATTPAHATSDSAPGPGTDSGSGSGCDAVIPASAPASEEAPTPGSAVPAPAPAPEATPAHGTPIPAPSGGTHGVQAPSGGPHETSASSGGSYEGQAPSGGAHGVPVSSGAAHGESSGGAHGEPAASAVPQQNPYPPPGPVPQPAPQARPYTLSDPVPQLSPYPLPDHNQNHNQNHNHNQNQNQNQHPAPQSGPWHRYDPWAAPAPAPLQQSGAVVLTEGQRRRQVRRALVGGALALALVCGAAGGLVGAYLERNGGVSEIHLPQAGAEPTDRPAGSVAGIAARALPSVVTLHVTGAGEQGTGTGFVLDTSGHILTNNHVVEPAGSSGDITVAFSGGESAKARVVGRDSGYDLAVVQVKGVHGLAPLPLGNSDNVQVGDPVVAIGAPFDLADTVTSGIISAKGRPITAGGESGDGGEVSYVDALQTDAPINPGNSGGPLLDAQARVIGINSAIRSADSGSDTLGGQAGSIGLGFAIPVNQAKRVAEELINDGRATHPVIGVTLDMAYTGDGARIGTQGSDGPAVTTGGPGDLAGLRAGDVITEVDGQRVHSGQELIVKIRAHRPGDHLGLTLERGGEEKRTSLVLGSSEHT
ncbi:trypsin-like peptidase domain-containing protein [Streptomyces sp. NPDC001270]|uniref:S1C family serine protease n=1 Tax=Streptomyces sp. NPDC001270 TaxID=3364554 RepID=UPI0036974414